MWYNKPNGWVVIFKISLHVYYKLVKPIYLEQYATVGAPYNIY